MKSKAKKNFTITKLFRSNKFLIIFSFVTACIIWLFFSQGSQEDYTATINDIPISIDLSQEAQDDGLQVITGGETLASVRISGNRLSVGNITKNDIQVVAEQSASIITSPNTYSLQLVAKQNGVKSDYEILSVNPTAVTVVVDRIKEKELEITDNIEYTYTVDEQYYAGKPVLSKNKIIIKGPQSEIDKIETAEIEGEFKGDLNKSTSNEYTVKLYDENHNEVTSENITTDIENNEITVAIAILSKKEIPINVTFNNVPSGINPADIISVDPKSIMVAGSENILSQMENISLNPIDFNSITPSTSTINVPIELPSTCININNIDEVTITFNLEDYSQKSIEVNNFKIINIEDGFEAEVTTSSVVIDIMGPKEDVEKITESDIKAVIDLKDSKAVGTIEIPFTVEISDIKNCWSFNVDKNTVTISVTQTEE